MRPDGIAHIIGRVHECSIRANVKPMDARGAVVSQICGGSSESAGGVDGEGLGGAAGAVGDAEDSVGRSVCSGYVVCILTWISLLDGFVAREYR